ncbi:MAG: sel1 repeat family protein, partial [Gammaproteobacteria bacterium]|nr:sel1 repeat family protein [Gammaproteobacteria bacterium]
MKLKAFVYYLGLMSIGVDLYANDALLAYRLGQYQKAAAEFRDNSPQDAFGQFYWGEMNLYGYGIAKDNDKAIEFYQQAAEKGFLPAQQIMARYALLIQKNPEEALLWFKKAADKQDVLAMMYCAGAYLYGYGVNRNDDMARKYYIAAAKLGNPLAQTTLAEHFFDSKHGQNKQLAEIWLNKAVAQNDIAGLMLKAKICYADKQYEQAQQLLNQALKQHFWPAYYVQGLWSLESKKYTLAHRNFLIAARHGYAAAQLSLAEL